MFGRECIEDLVLSNIFSAHFPFFSRVLPILGNHRFADFGNHRCSDLKIVFIEEEAGAPWMDGAALLPPKDCTGEVKSETPAHCPVPDCPRSAGTPPAVLPRREFPQRPGWAAGTGSGISHKTPQVWKGLSPRPSPPDVRPAALCAARCWSRQLCRALGWHWGGTGVALGGQGSVPTPNPGGSWITPALAAPDFLESQL